MNLSRLLEVIVPWGDLGQVPDKRRKVVVVQPLSHVGLSVAPWTAARQASLSFSISQSLLKLMSIESVMPANHLILCRRLSSCPQSCPVSSPVNRSSHQVAKVLRIQDWLIYTSKALRDVVYSLEERLI